MCMQCNATVCGMMSNSFIYVFSEAGSDTHSFKVSNLTLFIQHFHLGGGCFS